MAAILSNLSERIVRGGSSVVFGRCRYGPGGTCGPRIQQDFQLVLMDEGRADVTLDDGAAGRVSLAADEAGLMRPGRREFFRFTPDAPTRHDWCAVAPGLLRALPEERLLAAAGRVVAVSARLRAVVDLAFTVQEEGPAAGLLASLACAVFEEFLLAVEAPGGEGRGAPLPPAVRRAREFIGRHYPEPLDLARLGRAAGVAPKHLAKLFRQHLAVTPIRYLWQVRAARGAQLLTDTGLSLTEIAERTGFQNPFHFSRLIRQRYGSSPRRLRTERWNRAAAPTPGHAGEGPGGALI